MKPKLSYNLDISDESRWFTVTTSQAVRSSIAFIQEIGDFRCGPEYFTHRESLPSYLVKLCVDGKGIMEYDGKQYEVRPGQLFWIDCMKPQYYRTDPETGTWNMEWVHFYGPSCAAYYDLFMMLNDNSPVADAQTDGEIRNILDILLKMYAGGGNTLRDDIQASGLLIRLMTHCISFAGADTGKNRLPRYVMDVRDYIDRNYDKPITLDSLAHEISINKFYLQKLFKRHIGLSPNEYLIYTRLNHAKLLLRTSDRSVNQVAAEVGFGNIGHFIELFKKYEQTTPGLYRRSWYKPDENDLEEHINGDL